ncbi:hypothetical protein P691DRAFT_667823 [Macrolepiota fuliginosa MF-IS2]|uniref:TEA domain-containing protein n=1 Tax=Macrolepiota fuliginosa MF-IS2 TaxID=1400762 RepID=A0A9P5XF89_9AGAR|nr:hypothetical protein P691DRAFT_667823 [Macrolepiota fuliginosa MF-IS2]
MSHQASSSLSTSTPSSPQPSDVSGLTCPSLNNPKTQDVFQSIVKGRKSWKTLRGGEVVWPPELEAALIEGLEQYTPDDSRETRLLGRFPMRNRFISEYIYKKTGKRRTAKQVGSRLQQLRDTCGGRQRQSLNPLLKLLTPYRPQHRASRPQPLNLSGAASDSDSNSDGSTPATPTEAHATLQSLLYRGVGGLGRDEVEPQNIIYIDLIPNNAPLSSDALQVSPPISEASGHNIVRASQYPRRIHDINPTVTLLAHSSLTLKSHFVVRSRAGVVHSEVATMTLVGPTPGGSRDGLLYSTRLVPTFWNELCTSPVLDPTQYTIIQKVTQEPYNDNSAPLYSAAYKFTFPFLTGTNTQLHNSSSFPLGEPVIQGSPHISFDLDDLLTFESDAFNEFSSFNNDKSMDLYHLNACLAAEWRIHSPATSSSTFSDAHMSPNMGEIPTIVSISSAHLRNQSY